MRRLIQNHIPYIIGRNIKDQMYLVVNTYLKTTNYKNLTVYLIAGSIMFVWAQVGFLSAC